MRLVSLVRSLGLDGLRVGKAEQVHLTAQFIGDTASRELDSVIESVRAAAAGAPHFSLTVESLIALPARGPARLVAAATDAPAPLLELHRRLAHRLARIARRDSADRFLPHITLGRFAPPRTIHEAERRALDTHAPTGLCFEVASVKLMRSTLHPTGAEHHEVTRCELRPG